MKKVERTKENLAKCLCKECPSYTFVCKMMAMPGNVIFLIDPLDDERSHAEAMFCAFHKSQCINEEKGCKCPDCDIYSENELGNTYFCTNEG